jgi:protein O-mannosyl-transferase
MDSADSHPRSRPQGKLSFGFWLASFSLVVLVCVIFGRTGEYGFVNYDDGSYVYGNSHVFGGLSMAGAAWAFTHVHSQNWHPLTTLSHMLDCQLFGVKPGGPHLINVLLHAVNVLLLFLVLRHMTAALWRSAFVAAVWAVHPLRVESVAWISERKDVLSGLFFLLTIAAYLRYADRPTLLRYMVVAVSLAAGLMAKPMLVTTPLVLLLLDYWPLRRNRQSAISGPKSEVRDRERKSWPELFLEKIPLLLLSGASSVATILAQRQATGSADELPLAWRFENALVTAVTYTRQTFWPSNLSVFYPHPEGHLNVWSIIAAVLFLIAVSAIAFAWRRKSGYLLTGWFWYLIMLFPVIGIVQVGLQGHADRYTYLPQIGLLVALVWGIADLTFRWPYRIAGLSVLAALMLCGLSASAWQQVGYWKGSETLWTHALQLEPNSDVARGGRGDVLLGRGDVDGAIRDFNAALSIRPNNAEVHSRLADALLRKGNTAEAIAHWEKALEMQPEDVTARDRLGAALAQEGRVEDAIAQWRVSLRYDTGDGNALNDLAWVLATSSDASTRDGGAAVAFAQRASELAGGSNPMILRTLGAAYAESGQFARAIETASQGAEAAAAQSNSALAEELRRNAAAYGKGSPMRDSSLTRRPQQ